MKKTITLQSLPSQRKTNIRPAGLLFSMVMLFIGGNGPGKDLFLNSYQRATPAQTLNRGNSPSTPEILAYRLIHRYPHDPRAFTQGLFYDNGYIYEGTGQLGLSSLRKTDIKTGAIIKIAQLPQPYFGEGVTAFNDKIFQLTWISNCGFVYDKKSLRKLYRFDYPQPMQGWGITTDGSSLIMSDGSATLYFIEPDSFSLIRQITVQKQNEPLYYINELEYIDGMIFANVWQTNLLVRIDPHSGLVTGILNLKELVPKGLVGHSDYVLNGIAYDPGKQRLFVTGKMWPVLYEIELKTQK